MTRPLVQPIVSGSAAARTLYRLLGGERVVTVRADLDDDPHRVLANVLAYLAPRCPEDAVVSMMVARPQDREPTTEALWARATAETTMEVETFHGRHVNFWPTATWCLSLEVWSPFDTERHGGILLLSQLLIIDPVATPRRLWSPFIGAGQLLLLGSAEDPEPQPGPEGLAMIADDFRADWGPVPVEIILAGT